MYYTLRCEGVRAVVCTVQNTMREAGLVFVLYTTLLGRQGWCLYCTLHYEGGRTSVCTARYTAREAEPVFVLYTTL